ncbi:hypothetical protein [Clostridium sardiniense]|uniref:hypothetical protein n=1 Tax=Clostridium sardiniense TaxID=29369 RepID=UPI003D3269E5
MRGKKLIMCLAAVVAIGAAVACTSRNEIAEFTKTNNTTNKKSDEEISTNKDVISQINIEENLEVVDNNTSDDNSKSEDLSNETKDVVEQIQETEVFGQVTEKPVMDEKKTNKIGTYAEVTIKDKSKFTDANLIKFYKDTVEDSNYKWVTLKLSNKKGIQFTGESFIFKYGTLDDNGRVIDIEGSGNIMEDKIEYQKK